MKDYFLGIDIGTSNIKAVLFDRDAYQVAMHSVECSIDYSAGGRAEMDPDKVLEAIFESVRMCVSKQNIDQNSICGIGLSSHMHSLMAVDKAGNPLTPLMLWADIRASAEASFINDHFDIAGLYNRTGCRIQHPMYPLSKLCWLKSNDPAVFDKAYKFITIKEYLLYKLFGKYQVDFTIASSQGYCNLWSRQWDEEILKEILGIKQSRLGEITPCTQAFSGMAPEYARAMGIDSRLPIVIGSGDGITANIGCGIFDNSSVSSTVGTSGAIRVTVNKPLLDPMQQTWCYCLTGDMWVAGGAMNNGGLVLKWMRDRFGDNLPKGREAYKVFDSLASEVPPGCEGLVALPYLIGERSPDWNADARGILYGLRYSHGKSHLIRAAMEGVMYRLYSIYEVISGLELDAGKVIASGGYTNSDFWLQMQADVFGKEIAVSGVSEASALGAAYLCMVSLGAVRQMGQVLPGMKAVKHFSPNGGNHEIYQETYKQFQQVYKNMY